MISNYSTRLELRLYTVFCHARQLELSWVFVGGFDVTVVNYVAHRCFPKSVEMYSSFEGVNGSCIISNRFSFTDCDTASICQGIDSCGIAILVFFGSASVRCP